VKVELRKNREGKVRTVRIDMTNEDVQGLRNTPTAPIGRARAKQWAENVVRAIGYTPERDDGLGPIIDSKRGVSNDGFTAVVWVKTS